MITVLYVDDEPVLLDLAKRFLERTKEFKVLTTTSAHEALEMLKKNPPDAIVSDYMMPEMDGISLLKEIRKKSKIPFIMFTGRGNEMVVIDAMNHGADYYVQKGADPQALFRELTYKLRLSVQRRHTEEEGYPKKTVQAIINGLPDPVLILSPDGFIKDLNTKAEEFFSDPDRQVSGKHLSTQFFGLKTTDIEDEIGRALSGEAISGHWRRDAESPSLNISMQGIMLQSPYIVLLIRRT